jgi:predicted nucleic acid-binding protein
MTAAIDTNILFDILLPDPNHLESSLSLLTSYGKSQLLIISEVVYGELASQFSDRELLVDFLTNTDIRLVSSSPKALWISSRAWKIYTKNRSQEFQCNSCGNKQMSKCERCDRTIIGKQHIISDFLIGGHALVHSGTLLTRDRGYYRRYFPELTLAN